MSDSELTLKEQPSQPVVEETIDLSIGIVCKRILMSAVLFATLGMCLLTMFFLVANLAGLMSGKAKGLNELLWNTTFFLAFAAIFLSFPSLTLAGLLFKSQRVRRVSAEPTAINIERAKGAIRIPIEHLHWKVVDQLAFDQSGFYLQRGPLVVVSTRSSALAAGIEPAIFACGFSTEAFEKWTSFLKAHEVPQRQHRSRAAAVLRFAFSAPAGAMLFGAIGLIVRLILNIRDSVLAFALIGLMNGLLFAIGWGTLRNWEYNDRLPMLRRFGGPIIMVAFAQYAVMIGLVGGWKFAIACGVLNGIVGFFVFRWFYTIAESKNEELEATSRAAIHDAQAPSVMDMDATFLEERF